MLLEVELKSQNETITELIIKNEELKGDYSFLQELYEQTDEIYKELKEEKKSMNNKEVTSAYLP